MPRPSLRTRSKKRKHLTLPGGKRKVSHGTKAVGSPKCSNCGNTLNYQPHSKLKLRKLPKSQRRVSRIYSGKFCHICLREALKMAAQTL